MLVALCLVAATASVGFAEKPGCIKPQRQDLATGTTPAGRTWRVSAAVHPESACESWLLRLNFHTLRHPQGQLVLGASDQSGRRPPERVRNRRRGRGLGGRSGIQRLRRRKDQDRRGDAQQRQASDDPSEAASPSATGAPRMASRASVLRPVPSGGRAGEGRQADRRERAGSRKEGRPQLLAANSAPCQRSYCLDGRPVDPLCRVNHRRIERTKGVGLGSRIAELM